MVEKDGKAESDSSIAQDVSRCLEAFKRIDKDLLIASPHMRMKLPSDGLRDQLGRFQVWSGNVGAHRQGRASLDYKLREASHIRDRVIELLRNDLAVLEEIRAIIAGEKVSWEDMSGSDSDDSMSDTHDGILPTTEVVQLLSNVAEINTCLMRLSMSIRNPAPHDQFKISKNIDFASYEAFDVDHVREKFPKAPEYLATRLGKAISRRRQYLRYRDEHRKRYEQGLVTPAGEQIQATSDDEVMSKPHAPATVVTNSKKAQSTVASSIPMAMKATSSLSELGPADDVEDTLSETSYASSSNTPTALRPPPLPEQGQNNEPFECQLCFRITAVNHLGAWYKHVYRDLQPYVCTFESCDAPDRTYESRHEWTEHELQFHLGYWECVDGCNEVFDSSTGLRDHLGNAHAGFFAERRLDELVKTFHIQSSPINPVKCALCLQTLSSLAQLHRHMGKHQEELALFALPPHLGQDLDVDEDASAVPEVLSYQHSIADQSANANLLCPDCGFECSGSLQEQSHMLRSHANEVHADVATGLDALTDAQMLERYPLIATAMDSQTFDSTLLPSSLRARVPDVVRTWQELKHWSSSDASQVLLEQPDYRLLQAAQYRLILSSQDADVRSMNAQHSTLSSELGSNDEDLEDDLSSTLDPHARTTFSGNLPTKMDINRVVEAHGGAEMLETVGHWTNLGYDLNLGRDLTNEEAAHVQQVIIAGTQPYPASLTLDGVDPSLEKDPAGSDPMPSMQRHLLPSLPLSPLDQFLHQSKESHEFKNPNDFTTSTRHPDVQEGGVLLDSATAQTSYAPTEPISLPRMTLPNETVEPKKARTKMPTLGERILFDTADGSNIERYEPSWHTTVTRGEEQGSDAVVRSRDRKSPQESPRDDRCGCRVDERIYFRADGHRSTFQDTSRLCRKARRSGKVCSTAEVRTHEYPDPTSSPITSSPITSNHYTQARRSSVSSRPSTREESIKNLKPEIHIEIGNKEDTTGASHVSITTGKSKRGILSSNNYEPAGYEADYESPAHLDAFSPFPMFTGRSYSPLAHHLNLASRKSSKRSDPLQSEYDDSDDTYDTPSLATGTTASSSGTRPSAYSSSHAPSPPTTMPYRPDTVSSPYRTTEFTPRVTFIKGSYAPEIIGPDEDRQRQRDERRQRQRDERRKRQEALDREVAARLIEEDNRRVSFEPSRPQGRKSSGDSTDEREQLRQQERSDQMAQEIARELTTREALEKRRRITKPAVPSRRNSVRMSSTEAAKQQMLIGTEARQMRKERVEAEVHAREKALFQQQPPDSRHYDQSGPRRPRIAHHGESRSDDREPVQRKQREQHKAEETMARRVDLVEDLQPNQPERASHDQQLRNDPTQARDARREPRKAPMVYYNNTTQIDLPQASEPRRPLSSHANRPFMRSAPTADPWDVRNMGQALPSPRGQGAGVGHNFPQPQAGFAYPQQASHRVNNAMYTGEYETDSEDDQDLHSPGRKH